jgi:hypothetical protein
MRFAFGCALLALSSLVCPPCIAQSISAQSNASQSGPAQTVPQQPDSTTGGEAQIKAEKIRAAEIKALELKFADLIVRGDWEAYEKYLVPDFARIGDDGKTESKEEVISRLKTGPRKIIVMEPVELRVRIYADTAILQGQRTTSVRESGRVSTRYERFMEVFVTRNGQWLLVAEQETAGGRF